jgi:hypothetical protein
MIFVSGVVISGRRTVETPSDPNSPVHSQVQFEGLDISMRVHDDTLAHGVLGRIEYRMENSWCCSDSDQMAWVFEWI